MKLKIKIYFVKEKIIMIEGKDERSFIFLLKIIFSSFSTLLGIFILKIIF